MIIRASSQLKNVSVWKYVLNFLFFFVFFSSWTQIYIKPYILTYFPLPCLFNENIIDVVPHIGYRAKPKFYDSLEDFPQAPDPEYDFYNESLKVIERLAVAAGDPMMKQKIEFFDNKLLVINNIEVRKSHTVLYMFDECASWEQL